MALSQERILQLTENRANASLRGANAVLNQNSYQEIAEKTNQDVVSNASNVAGWRNNFLVKAFDEVLLWGGQVISAAEQGLEQMVDMAARLTTYLGADEDKVQEFIDLKLSGAVEDSGALDYLSENRALSGKASEIADSVSQGVGNMLPSIMIGTITAGAGTALGAAGTTGATLLGGASLGAGAINTAAVQTASQVASLGALGLSAGGGAAQEATMEGASYDEATLYGIASGALEVAIEKVFGGVAQKVFGKGVLDNAIDNAIVKFTRSAGGTKVLSALADMGGEGLEEMVTEVVSPALKRAIYNPEAENATLEEILEAGLIGALTAGVMNGAGAVGRRFNKSARATTDIENYRKMNEYAEIALEQGDGKKYKSFKESANNYLKDFEKVIGNMSEARRTDVFSVLGAKGERGKLFRQFYDLENGKLIDGVLSTDTDINRVVTNLEKNKDIRDRLTKSLWAEDIDAILETFNTKNPDNQITREDILISKNNKAQTRLLNELNKTNMFKGVKLVFVDSSKMGNAAAFNSRGSDIIFVRDDITNFATLDKKASHEIFAHFVKNIDLTKGRSEYYKAFDKIKELVKQDEDLSKHLETTLENRAEDYNTNEIRNEEFVGEFIESVYSEDGITLVHKLANKNKSLLGKVVDFFRDLRDGVSHEKGDFFKRFTKECEDIETILSTAIEHRLDSVETIEELINSVVGDVEDDEYVDVDLENVDIQKSLVTWNDTGKTKLIELLKENDFSQEDIEYHTKSLDDIGETLEQIAKELGFKSLEDNLGMGVQYSVTKKGKDGKPKAVMSVLVSNGDYVVNFDLSTSCKKRFYYEKVMQALAIQGWFDTVVGMGINLTNKDIEAIRSTLERYGFEIPCATCYVENRRLYQIDWANGLVEKFNNAVKNKLKDQAFNEYYNFATIQEQENDADKFEKMLNEFKESFDDLSADGTSVNAKGDAKLAKGNIDQRIAEIVSKLKNPKLLRASDFLTAKGLEMIKSTIPNLHSISLSSYGAGTPKPITSFSPYDSEISALMNNQIKDINGASLTGFKKFKDNATTRYLKEHNLTKLSRADNQAIFREAFRDYLYANGGLRFQSFSDSKIEEVFDILQLVVDASAAKLPMHMYTKEIWASRLLAKSGIKLNMSLISLVFDGDGVNAKAISGLRKINSKNDSISGITIDLELNPNGLVMAEDGYSLETNANGRFEDINGNEVILDGYKTKKKESVVRELLPKVATKDSKYVGTYETIFADAETRQLAKDGKVPTEKWKKAPAPVHSIGFKDSVALMLTDGASSNVGTIAIGFSHAHILAMLDNPLVRMIIPFHASGLSKDFAVVLSIDTALDYTKKQSESVLAKGFDLSQNETYQNLIETYPEDKAEIDALIFEKIKGRSNSKFMFNQVYQEIANNPANKGKDFGRMTIEKYFEFCNKTRHSSKAIKIKYNGVEYDFGKPNIEYTLAPKFSEFKDHPNYYKLITDFNLYDAITEENAPQREVRLDLPTGEVTKESLEAYKERLRQQKIFSEEEIEYYAKVSQESANDIVKKEASARNDYINMSDPKYDKALKEIKSKIKENHSDIQMSRMDNDKKVKAKENTQENEQPKETFSKPKKINKILIKAQADSKNGKVFDYNSVEEAAINIAINRFNENHKGINISEATATEFVDRLFKEFNLGSQNISDFQFNNNVDMIISMFVDKVVAENYVENSLSRGQDTLESMDISNALTNNPLEYEELKKNIKQDLISARKANGKELGRDSKVKKVLEDSLKKVLEDSLKKVEHYKELAETASQVASKTIAINREVKEIKLVLTSKRKVASSLAVDGKLYNLLSKAKNTIWESGKLSRPVFKRFYDSFNAYFNKENPLFASYFEVYEETKAKGGMCAYYDLFEGLEFMKEYYKMDANTRGTSKVTLEWLTQVEKILGGALHLFENYDMVKFNGAKTSVNELVNETIEKQNEVNNVRGNKPKNIVKRGMDMFVDPSTVILDAVGFDETNPLYVQFEHIKDCADEATYDNYTTTNELRQMHNDKQIRNRLKSSVEISTNALQGGLGFMLNSKGTEVKNVTISNLISLRLQLTQRDAWLGIYNNGIKIKDAKTGQDFILKIPKTESPNPSVDILESTINAFTEYVDSLLNESDQKIINEIKKVYKAFTEKKAQTDKDLYGVTNIIEGEYAPIYRDGDYFSTNIAKDNTSSVFGALFNLSMNKTRKQNVSAPIRLVDCISETLRFSDLMSKYCHLAVALDTFGKIYGNVVKGDGANSVRRVMGTYDSNLEQYLKELFADIVTGRSQNDPLSKFFAKVRGLSVTAALGANVSVMGSQLASIPAAFPFVGAKDAGRAVLYNPVESWKEICEHSKYGFIRYYDNGVAKSNALVDSLSKLGNASTRGIQEMDRLAIIWCWNASKAKVERLNPKIDTKSAEYFAKVDKEFKNIVRKSQPNYSAVERSALQRTPSEIAKNFAMYTSVGVKYLSMIYSSVQNFVFSVRALNKAKSSASLGMNKTAYKNTTEYQKAKANVSKASKTMLKYTLSVMSATAMFVGLKQLINKLLKPKRDDEEENAGITFLKNYVSSMIGVVPIVKDVYAFFADEREIENVNYNAINNLLDSTKTIVSLIGASCSGEYVDDSKLRGKIKNVAFSLAHTLGIPARNVEKLVVGLLRHTDIGYKYDNFFETNPKYAQDLKSAFDNGDDKKAEMILNYFLDYKGIESNTGNSKEIMSLYKDGYTSVMPKSASSKLTYNNEEYALNKKEVERFREIYSQADNKVSNLIKLAQYGKSSKETQSKAIKMIYDYYYTLAVRDYIGDEEYSKVELFADVVPIETLAIISKASLEIKSTDDTTKKIQVMQMINQQRISAEQKTILLAYLGYKIDNSSSIVKNYINSRNIPKVKKDMLIKYFE